MDYKKIAWLAAFLFLPLKAEALFAVNEPSESRNYYQCLLKATDTDADPAYMDTYGNVGLFRLTVQNAALGGLCSNDVPVMGSQQIWKLCDFKGSIAQQFKIANVDDLRLSPNAAQAQIAIIQNLTKSYDDYFYKKKYDEKFNTLVNGVYLTPEILRILTLAYGKVVTDEFVAGKRVLFQDNTSPYSMATCVEQCLTSEKPYWICRINQ